MCALGTLAIAWSAHTHTTRFTCIARAGAAAPGTIGVYTLTALGTATGSVTCGADANGMVVNGVPVVATSNQGGSYSVGSSIAPTVASIVYKVDATQTTYASRWRILTTATTGHSYHGLSIAPAYKASCNKIAGFTDPERDGFAELLSAGLHNVWREKHPDVRAYT